jgi:hypothetical protein
MSNLGYDFEVDNLDMNTNTYTYAHSLKARYTYANVISYACVCVIPPTSKSNTLFAKCSFAVSVEPRLGFL